MTASWKTYALDEIARIQGGGTPSRNVSEYFGGDIPWVTPTDLPPIGSVGTLNGTKECITEAGLANSSAKLIDAGSILFSSRASIGKLVVTTRPCATNQGFANFTPHPGFVDPWFLAFLLRRHTSDITKLAGKTTFLEVPRKRLKNFKVQIPDPSEQRRIVARIKECMERVDEIVGLSATRQIELDGLVPAALEDIFLGDCSEEVSLFSLLAEEPKNGCYLPKEHYVTEGGVPIVRMGEMFRRFEVEKDVEKQVLPNGKLMASHCLQEGDVLVARRSIVYEGSGSMAMVTPHNTGSLFESSIIRLRFDQTRVLPAFVVAFFHSREGVRRRMGITMKSTISGVNQQGLRRLSIPVSDLAAQTLVLDRVAAIRQAYAEMVEIIPAAEVGSLRDSVLRRAFAGEL